MAKDWQQTLQGSDVAGTNATAATAWGIPEAPLTVTGSPADPANKGYE
jgi:hypothetical protein